MKILIFSNIPSPYFVEYLNELGKYADVLAVFERHKASNRDQSWENVNSKNFNYKYLNGISINSETAFSLRVISEINRNRDRVIIFADPTTGTGITGIFYCKLKHIPYVLQSEGGFAKNGKGLKEKFKKCLFKGASLYLTGMKPEQDYFSAYGAPIKKVKQYPFASLSENDLIQIVPDEREKAVVKDELGIKYNRIVLYVGSMIHRKGIDVLIRACNGLDDNVGVYLVGGNETDEYRIIANQYSVRNLNYVNHLQLEKLKKYYLCADVFVLPTRMDTWGLVINEAMSFGLPVITTDHCVAGTQLIENGINGFVIENENYEQLHNSIIFLLNKPELRRQIAKNNIGKIKSHTYENMGYVIYEYLRTFFPDQY